MPVELSLSPVLDWLCPVECESCWPLPDPPNRPPKKPPEPWLAVCPESWPELVPWPDWLPEECDPDDRDPASVGCDVFWVAASWMLWLSGWDAACESDRVSNGVALTGAADAATLAALATGAFEAAGLEAPALDSDGPFETDGPLDRDGPLDEPPENDGPFDSDGPFASDGEGENPAAAGAIGPPCGPPKDWPCWSPKPPRWVWPASTIR